MHLKNFKNPVCVFASSVKKLCSHQILTNKTLFNLEFFGFLKQAKTKERRKKTPPFFRSFLLAYTL
ncbi:hypothetical protein FIM52_06190 [Helicobacter pylori]|nr:hypothetical protein FIM68_06125 [Helicobacter pylori]TPH79284.1 hypothetical protein FIM52_06190 [Helicobacter pylori]